MFPIGIVSKQYTFTAGSTITASEHNTNFDTLYDEINGNLENVNIKATAAIAYSKLNLTGNIINTDVKSTAAIAGSKIYPAFVSSMSVAGNVTLATAGNKFLIKEGENASMGTALMGGGTALVADTLISDNSRVFLTRVTLGGTAGALWVHSVTSGASFRVSSTIATESSKLAYLIIEPA